MSTLVNHRREKDKKTNSALFEREINQLWTYFISAFEYEKYYTQPEDLKKSLNEHFSQRKKISRTDSIRLLNEFFIRHKIFYSDDFNLEINSHIDEEHNIYILSNKKLWVMFIILMSKTIDFSTVIQIFCNALRNKVDSVFLFEFFLIYISTYITESEYNAVEEELSSIIFPEEFVQIYKENKTLLDEIFKVEKSKGFNLMSTIHNQSFNNNVCLDFSFQNDEEDCHNSLHEDIHRNSKQSYKGSNHYKEKDINQNEEEYLKNIIDEHTLINDMDDIIDNTKMDVIDKSPSSLNKDNSKIDRTSVSPLFFNKSPTLDSYLIPNAFKNEDEQHEEYEDKDNHNNTHYEEDNYNNQFNHNEYNHIDTDDPKKTLDMQNIQDDEEEDFLTDSNLHIEEPDYLGHNNFAILIPLNMLREIHKNIDYIVTPLKSSFSLLEKIVVQGDLESLRQSQYHNFVYFPYNDKLIQYISNQLII